MSGANIIWKTADEAFQEVARLMHGVEARAGEMVRDLEAAYGGPERDPQQVRIQLAMSWPDLLVTYDGMVIALAELQLARHKLTNRLDDDKRERRS